MNPSLIALGVAVIIVIFVLVHIVGLNFVIGTGEFFFGKPKLKFLKSAIGQQGLAFSFNFNPAKEPARYDKVKVRLFNPFGKPEQVEIAKPFDPQKQPFSLDVDMGSAWNNIINATELARATIQVELSATKDGVSHQYDFNAQKFFKLMNESTQSIEQTSDENAKDQQEPVFSSYKTGLPHSMIADQVPGKGVHLKIATNPAFADVFGSPVPGQAAAGGGGGAGGAAAENFPVSKVWIIEGCIVCNACEDIYPEVFDVQTDTCIVRPDAAPGSELLKDGLKIAEAADACPVEVIKYDKA